MAIYGKYLKVTKLSELPIEIQTALCEERVKLCEKWKHNDAYNVCFTNAEGTRYFRAHRKTHAHPVYDMPFGGGSTWEITYGKILWDTRKAPLGDEVEYRWIRSGKVFGKAANGTEIPKRVSTKKEVMEIAKSIGILVM
jgi:hypothetical protein